MFVSKFEKNYRREFKRECEIQNCMNKNKFDRVRATHQVDYEKELRFQTAGKALSSVIFGLALPLWIRKMNFNTFIHKNTVMFPVLLAGAYGGSRLWDKLNGHYLNYLDIDVSHDFKINYEKRYKIHQINESEANDFKLKTLRKSTATFVRQGKNDDEYSNISSIRNLENIVYCSEEELTKCKTTLELQVLIDSKTPTINTKSLNEHQQDIHLNLYNYKLRIENGKYFRSEKDRLLGLPFMMKRHQQYPEPHPGTWQYNLFEELYGYCYSLGKDEIDTEEKIHKYNYKNYIHPSVVEKYDDNLNSELEMIIKLKNVEDKTRLQELKEQRKFFCTKILPKLNLLRDENKGRDFAYTYLNSLNNKSSLQQHFSKNYSNDEEEFLLRQLEELKLINKNPSVIEEVISPAIPEKYRGIREKELREILTSPKKRDEVKKVMSTFKTTSPQSKYDLIKMEQNRVGLLDTVIEEGIDLSNPENNFSALHAKTFDNPDSTELEDAAINRYNDENKSSFPLGHPGARYFKFDNRVSFEDYDIDEKNYGFASFKSNRCEYRLKEQEEQFIKEHSLKFGNSKYNELEGFVVPHLERANDEAQEKIFKKNPLQMHKDRKNLYSNTKSLMEDFVSMKLDQNLAVSEEDIDELVFKASYQKSVEETDEYKNLSKRTRDELLTLFKTVGKTPKPYWDHGVTKKIQQPKRVVYDGPQLNDPLYFLYSEVEQPEAMRKVLSKWRSGAELRTKLPYYPETKKSNDYFKMI